MEGMEPMRKERKYEDQRPRKETESDSKSRELEYRGSYECGVGTVGGGGNGEKWWS